MTATLKLFEVVFFTIDEVPSGLDPFNDKPKVLSGITPFEILKLNKGKDNFIYWRRDEVKEPWMNVTELHKGNIVNFPE